MRIFSDPFRSGRTPPEPTSQTNDSQALSRAFSRILLFFASAGSSHAAHSGRPIALSPTLSITSSDFPNPVQNSPIWPVTQDAIFFNQILLNRASCVEFPPSTPPPSP